MVQSYISSNGLHDLQRDLLLAVLRDQPPKPWAFVAEYLSDHYGEKGLYSEKLTREALRCKENQHQAPPDIQELINECAHGLENQHQAPPDIQELINECAH